jgi:hypothetical protein
MSEANSGWSPYDQEQHLRALGFMDPNGIIQDSFNYLHDKLETISRLDDTEIETSDVEAWVLRDKDYLNALMEHHDCFSLAVNALADYFIAEKRARELREELQFTITSMLTEKEELSQVETLTSADLPEERNYSSGE